MTRSPHARRKRNRLPAALAFLVPIPLATCSEPLVSPRESLAVPSHAVAAVHGSGIVINEVMADPNAVSDDSGEWFELHNTGSAAVDVGGWTIGSNNDAPHTIGSSVSVAAGGYAVLARSSRTKNNGGVSAAYQYGTGITLANANDWLALRDGTGATVDSVAWTSMPTGATRGVSDPLADHVSVDGGNWHTATSTYGKGDKGTPGAKNDGYVAAVAAVTVSPATASTAVGSTQQFTASATDAAGAPVATTYTWTSSNASVATVDGSGLTTAVSAGTTVIRATASNGVYGDATMTVTSVSATATLIITEVLADPSAVTDANGEWFEVHNPGSASVDLQGWQLASNNDAAHTVSSTVIVPAGGYVALGRVADPATNGGANVAYAFGSALTLANASDWIALRDASGTTIDSVAWSSTAPAGASRALIDVTSDNTAVSGAGWATSTAVFGAGDRGTPAAANSDVASGGGGGGGDTGGGGGTPGELVVRVLDVGQGDATYITDGVSKVFIDGGPDMASFGAHLDALGLNNTTIDVVIISHAHFDHYSGLRELFKTARGITVRYLFENKDAGSAVSLAELRDSINARVGRGELVYRDTDDPCVTGAPLCTITMAGGSKLHVLRPDPAGSTPNNRSGAVKLVGPDSASFSMWFAGDAEHEAIGWFDTGADYDVAPGMNVDVLKADHHGSCNGVTRRYLELLSPAWVAIGVGGSNTYGHVHQQTKDLFSSMGIPWYRTDQNGTVTFRTPGTAGGGYTVGVERGQPSMSGSTDKTSSQTGCQSL